MGLFYTACCGVKLPQSSKADQGLEDLVLKVKVLIPKVDQFLKSGSGVETVELSVCSLSRRAFPTAIYKHVWVCTRPPHLLCKKGIALLHLAFSHLADLGGCSTSVHKVHKDSVTHKYTPRPIFVGDEKESFCFPEACIQLRGPSGTRWY